MEKESNCNSKGEGNPFNQFMEYEGQIFYSDSESGYSEQSMDTQQNPNAQLNTSTQLNGHHHEIQNCKNVQSNAQQTIFHSNRHNRDMLNTPNIRMEMEYERYGQIENSIPEGGIFEMELNSEQIMNTLFTLGTDEPCPVDTGELIIEGRMEEGQEEGMEVRQFHRAEQRQDEYRWNEIDECIQELRNPELGRRMQEIRTTNERISKNEIERINYEIKINNMEEKHEIEKGRLIEELDTVEKKAEKLFTALRIGIQDKESALSINRQLTAELKIREQELSSERSSIIVKDTIINTWIKLCGEKDKELEKVREDNKELRREISELRMTIYENRKQNRNAKR